MDISDLTNKEPPKHLEKEKDFIPRYTKEALKLLKNCVSIVMKAVEDSGLTEREFHELRVKNIDSLEQTERNKITDKIKAMKYIRDSIEIPTDNTLFQKAINKEDFEKYINGEYTKIGGFVCRAQDTSDLNTYNDYYESLRLDYEPKRFFKDKDSSMYVIRFKTDRIDYLKTPYSKYLDKGDKTYLPPCTGNGFTAAENGKIIPEYLFANYVQPYDGAEIYEVNKNGEENIRAVYNKRYKKFMIIEKNKE
jgi:hypothetical protein